jgi:ApaG protein
MEQRHHQPSSRHKSSGHLEYERVTRGIRVSVRPAFLDDQSDPEASRYLWSYTVTIENKSPETVQLMSRYWHITDAVGHIQEVRGPGVVGAQPVLEPGQVFEYTSGCPLPTASGAMAGKYQMKAASGEAFEAEIPAFLLESPHERRQIH